MDVAGLPARLQGRLARGRAMAKARMGAENDASTGNVYRLADRVAQDEETGLQGPAYDEVHHQIPFRLAGSERGSNGTRTVSTPSGDLQLAVRTCHFPWNTDDLADGDLVEITTGENAGTYWQIVEGDWADQQTARRVPVIAAQRPEEWS